MGSSGIIQFYICPAKSYHASQDFRQGCSQEWQSCQGSHQGRQEEEGQEEGVLCHLHLQGTEAGPPGHWSLFQGYVHHELLRQRSLREDRCGGQQASPLQQEVNHHLSRDPDCSSSPAARRVGQACCVRGHQGCDQVHQLQIVP